MQYAPTTATAAHTYSSSSSSSSTVRTYVQQQQQQLAGSSLLACLHTVTAAATSVHTAAAPAAVCTCISWTVLYIFFLSAQNKLKLSHSFKFIVLILCSNSTLVFHLKNRFFPLKFQHSAETKLVSSFLSAISFGRVVLDSCLKKM